MTSKTQAKAFDIPLWLGTRAQFIAEVRNDLHNGAPTQSLHTLNPEILMTARRNPAYREVLKDGRWNTVDGVGLQVAMQRRGALVPERLCGSDLIYDLAQLCVNEGRGLYLLGGAPSRLAKAMDKLRERFPGLDVRGLSPAMGQGQDFREMDQVRTDLRNQRPAVVAVCLGAPRQEVWIERNRALLTECGVAVAGGFGGTVDFVSGEVVRAPVWVRKLGLEWAYRLLGDPKRLKRQLGSLPLFAVLAFTGRGFTA